MVLNSASSMLKDFIAICGSDLHMFVNLLSGRLTANFTESILGTKAALPHRVVLYSVRHSIFIVVAPP